MKRFLFLTLSFLFVFCATANTVAAQVAPTPITVNQSTVTGNIPQGGSCGGIGQACCGEYKTPPVRLNKPDIPLVGDVIGVFVSWINNIVSFVDGIADPLTGVVNDIRGNKVCSEGEPSDENNINKCICLPRESFKIAKLCTSINNVGERNACIKCSDHGIWTAIGCVDFKLQTFLATTVFGFGVGLAGFIALLCVIYSAITLQLSRGNPEKIKKAQEMMTSCILGLLIIIFSVLILRVIGVDILRIPGFG